MSLINQAKQKSGDVKPVPEGAEKSALDSGLQASPPRKSHRLLILGAAVLAYGVLFAIIFARDFMVRAPADYTHYRRPGDLFVSDGFGYYIYLPSVVIDRDLDFTNQLLHSPIQSARHEFYHVNPQTGLPGNGFQMGCSVVWAPAFLATHLALRGLALLGLQVPSNGFGYAYELPVYAWSFAFGFLGLWYIKRLLTDLYGDKVAIVTTLYFALATGVAAYLWFEPSASHIVSMSLIAMFFFYLHRTYRNQDRTWPAWTRLGLLLGLIALVRLPDTLIVLPVGWVVLSLFLRDDEGRFTVRTSELVKCLACFGVCAALVVLPQFLVWRLLYGEFVMMPANSHYDMTKWTQPDLLNYFISPQRGMFVWTPLLLIGTIGLVLGLRRGPAEIRQAVLVLVAAIYFNSCIRLWMHGCSFGDRRIVDYSVLFALGLGYLLSLRPAWVTRPWLHAIGIMLVLWNWVLMLRYFSHDLPESVEYTPYTWNMLIIDTFTFPARLVERLIL